MRIKKVAVGPWLCHGEEDGRSLKAEAVVAAELARKAHDECVSMGWACDSVIQGRQGINLAMAFMPPGYQRPKAAKLYLSLCSSRVVFSKGKTL